MSTKGVLPEPAEAVPRSGTEQPEAKAGAASKPLKRRRQRTFGLSGARGLILSLRRVGTQAERDRADEGAGAKGSEGRLRPAQRRSRNAASSAEACGG